MYRIRIARRTGKTAPESRGRDFKPGDVVAISIVNYPGKLHREGSLGWFVDADHKHQSWGFWTNGDIDSALIFGADDVAALIVPADTDMSDWPEAPFLIEVENRV